MRLFPAKVCALPKLSSDKREARVQIAKDVLRLLRASKIRASRGGIYLRATLPLPKQKKNAVEFIGFTSAPEFRAENDSVMALDARAALVELIEKSSHSQCLACAKGALLAAHVLRFDKATLGQVGGYLGPDGLSRLDASNVGCEGQLRAYFPVAVLHLIEDAFEGSVISDNYTARKRSISQEWRNAYPSDDDRLRAIMRNIVRNDGDFKFSEVVPPRKKAAKSR